MRRLQRLAAVAAAAVVLAGCATTMMTVSSHAERGLDFSQYWTYDWGPPDALPTRDPRLDENPFFKDQVQGAVEKELAARGLELAGSETPDLLIHYHANITQRIDVNRVDRAHGYGQPDRGPVEYEAGTLVLDVVDTRTDRLIWRGWARNSVEDMLDDPDRMAQRIHEAITRMLLRFPRTRHQ